MVTLFPRSTQLCDPNGFRPSIHSPPVLKATQPTFKNRHPYVMAVWQEEEDEEKLALSLFFSGGQIALHSLMSSEGAEHKMEGETFTGQQADS